MREKFTPTGLANIKKNITSSLEEGTLNFCQRDYIWPPPVGRAHWEYILKGLKVCIFLTPKIHHQELPYRNKQLCNAYSCYIMSLKQ